MQTKTAIALSASNYWTKYQANDPYAIGQSHGFFAMTGLSALFPALFPEGAAADAAVAIPRGFEGIEQFNQACAELCSTLTDAGITDARIGVRGSSVTGRGFRGTPFGPSSDIDFFAESDELTNGLRTSQNIPGFVHPDRISSAFPAVERWAGKWSGILGRDVNVGGFRAGTIPRGPTIWAK
jgi:hypothetical protein